VGRPTVIPFASVTSEPSMANAFFDLLGGLGVLAVNWFVRN